MRLIADVQQTNGEWEIEGTTAETGTTTAKNPSVATFYPDSDDDEDNIKLSDREQHLLQREYEVEMEHQALKKWKLRLQACKDWFRVLQEEKEQEQQKSIISAATVASEPDMALVTKLEEHELEQNINFKRECI